MRSSLLAVAIFAFASVSAVEAGDQPTAIMLSPIHKAQVVRGDDGMDHVEYDLMVVSVLPEPVTLSSITIIDPAGKELKTIEGAALAAVTQPLFAHTETPVIPPSAAVAVEVDLVLPPGTAPGQLTHRVRYALKPHSQLVPMFAPLEVDAPTVAIDRQPAILIAPPVKGQGWFVSSGCCKPNLHRDLRVAINGVRIETPETFSIDYAKVRNGRIFDGAGDTNKQHYAFEQDVFAVADGTVVSVQDGKPEMPPNTQMIAQSKDDYGGNHVILKIAPDVFALYLHLHPGSITVKVGEVVKAGARLAKIGNTGPSAGPHLHFGLYDKPDPSVGRSLPFVFDSFTMDGAVDLGVSEPDHLVIMPNSRKVRSAYPLYGGIQDYP
jgi:hypothetical protein